MGIKIFAVCFLFLVVLGGSVFAQTVPSEAINACNGKSQGDICSFIGTQSETVSGNCLDIPEGEVACVPNSGTPSEMAQGGLEKSQEVTEFSDVAPSGFWNRLFHFFFGWIKSNDKSNRTQNITSSNNKNKNQISTDNSSIIISSKVIVDTNQEECFDDNSNINCPKSGESFYGQDGNYESNQPNYIDNGDGTITDLNTGLMWIKDTGDKVYYYDAKDSFSYAGYDDWRIPTIKELYSLMDFGGQDVDPTSNSADNPFIDINYFVFNYGNLNDGDRIIDSQWITNNIYVSKVFIDQECFFGVNFADGRIKCYPTKSENSNNGYYLRYVRGEEGYGNNNFVDNGDGTITDNSSILMWQKSDSGEGLDWENALSYCEGLSLAGYDDWRLPNAKELQYIVDYTRSPDTTNSPAINSVFDSTSITDERGEKDWAFYWTGTTHKSSRGGDEAVYIGFGKCIGEMNGQVMDVHGAGCQRSDPKSGNENDYPSLGNGPQGDASRVFNMVRCVRG